MSDRQIIYDQEQGTVGDVLQMQQNYYIGLSRLMGQLINYPALGGFLCTPTSPASFGVNIGDGEIYSQEVTDATDYGVAPNDIAADPTLIVKQGIYYAGTFSAPAPVTIGYSINYLIQVGFEETDGSPQSRIFFTGPALTVNTVRQDLGVVQIKAGTAATTGTQVTPTPDVDFVGAWVITVNYGDTAVLSGAISQYPNAPFFGASYGGAIQNMVQAPPFAAPAYVMTANLVSTQTISASPVTLQFIATTPDNPQGWWDNTTFTFTPTFPCTVIFSLGLQYDNTGQPTQEFAFGNTLGDYDDSGTILANSSNGKTSSPILKFSGSNSVSFYAVTSANPVIITEGTITATVIVN